MVSLDCHNADKKLTSSFADDALSGHAMSGDEGIAAVQRPSFQEALRFWFKLGWISFGGTAAHIAVMHNDLVVKKRWISNAMFLHALSHCMLLAAPVTQFFFDVSLPLVMLGASPITV
jgi:hypothetical protein